jgi:hypothetical protein
MNLSEFATISGRAATLAPRRGTRDSFTVCLRHPKNSDRIVSVKTAISLFFGLLSLFPSNRFLIGLASHLLFRLSVGHQATLRLNPQKTASSRHRKSSLLDSIAGE